MKQLSFEPDLTNFAPTVAMIMGLEKQEHMSAPVVELAEALMKNAGGTIEKALFFHADAVPAYVVEKNESIFAPVRKVKQIEIPFHAVMPSITPVCFAAMFSGAYPSQNGVPEYCTPILSDKLVQPAISCGTIIDILVQAGKKVAVVTCSNGCIASMLYGRGADMYIIPGDDDKLMYEKACEILQADKYDAIFLYQLSYDYTMHAYGPESKEALEVLDTITNRYETLVKTAQKVWKGYRIMTVFNSDHGAHLLSEGRGSHGVDIPEDMNMKYFWHSQYCE